MTICFLHQKVYCDAMYGILCTKTTGGNLQKVRVNYMLNQGSWGSSIR